MKVNQILTLLPNVQDKTTNKAIDKVLQNTHESFGDLLNKTIISSLITLGGYYAQYRQYGLT